MNIKIGRYNDTAGNPPNAYAGYIEPDPETGYARWILYWREDGSGELYLNRSASGAVLGNPIQLHPCTSAHSGFLETVETMTEEAREVLVTWEQLTPEEHEDFEYLAGRLRASNAVCTPEERARWHAYIDRAFGEPKNPE